MTDTDTTTENSADTGSVKGTGPLPADPEQISVEYVQKLRREAQTLRQRAKDAEEALQGFKDRFETLQRRDVDRLAAEHLDRPDDLFRFHEGDEPLLAQLVGDDGLIDPERVAERAAALVEQRPQLGANYRPETQRPPTDRPVESLRPGATPSDATETRARSWTDVIQNPGPGHRAGE